MALVRFSVKNFRSFRSEQSISLEAGRQGAGSRGRTFSTGLGTAPTLLHGAVIYGANSGGKTNLISAMSCLQDFVLKSAQTGQKGELIPVAPYRLDESLTDEPSELEIVFIFKDVLYQYGFAATPDRVHGEWLYETPKQGRIRHIFSREYDKTLNDYDWYINPRVRGEKKVWLESTRENALFLSTANQLNSKDLSPPFEWMSKYFRVLPSARMFGNARTAQRCLEDQNKLKILDLLQTVDPEITDLHIDESEFNEDNLLENFSEKFRAEILKNLKGKKQYDAYLLRNSREGIPIKFSMDEESTGNGILFGLAGPWLDTLENGLTLVIDELDSGLHPLALRALVSLFFSRVHNSGNAQLIITCHEATLLQDNLLRSDQVWFVDRNSGDGSVLYPLSDFKPRQNESFLRGYLGGRYRGIPLARTLS